MHRKLGTVSPNVSHDHVHEFGWHELDDVVGEAGFALYGSGGAGFTPYWSLEGYIGHSIRPLTDSDEDVNAWMSEIGRVAPEFAFCQIKHYRKVGP